MNRILIWSLVLLLMTLVSCDTKNSSSPEVSDPGALLINEILASNTTTNADEFGEFDDWVELYNGTENIVDVAGMYITDDPLDVNPWLIPSSDTPSTIIPPKGFLLLWCDKDPEQGATHVNIKLSASGESVILLDTDKSTLIDSVHFGAIETDVSLGREPDGAPNWVLFETPSPGSTN